MLTVESLSSLTPLFTLLFSSYHQLPLHLIIIRNPSQFLHSLFFYSKLSSRKCWIPSLMGTQHLPATNSVFELFYESELCPEEILTILQSLDDNNTYSNIFNVATAVTPGPLMKDKNRTSKENKKRKKPAKSPTSSSSLGLCSDEESEEGHAVLSWRKSIKKQKGSLSSPATSMEDGSGEEGEGVGGSDSNGKVVSHIAVERNRRKQMNDQLAVLRQLMPCFYVKKGDQASIIGGVIDYVNELHQVLHSLETKKRRKIYTSDVAIIPWLSSGSRFSAPQQHLNHRSFVNLPLSPRTPQSTCLYYNPLQQPSSSIPSPTSNSTSSIANMILMMNIHNKKYYGVANNELVACSKSDLADVEVKFCGANLELKTVSSTIAGQSVKIVLAIEDLSLEILQLSINTDKETVLNAFTIKIGIDCQLSAEELAQRIQQTFC